MLGAFGGQAGEPAVELDPASFNPYSTLHSFTGPPTTNPPKANDGASPLYGHLTPLGTVLYGMTYAGGANSKGAIFTYDTKTGKFSVVYSFAGGTGDGANPFGSLTPSGTTLYGMTNAGGDTSNSNYPNGMGTIFKYDTKSKKPYLLLHSFAAIEGRAPYGSLIVSGTALYGMAIAGGANGNGTIFKYDLNTGKLSVLHDFYVLDSSNAGTPWGSLALVGTTLYGLAEHGGQYSGGLGGTGGGVLFRINTDGTGYKNLHSFNLTDSSYPCGSLTLLGTNLYGLTYGGGNLGSHPFEYGMGTIFKYDTTATGDGFELLHSFSLTEGANPYADLALLGTSLYGMTYYGGDTSKNSNGMGTLFKYDTAENSFTVLHDFDSTGLANGSGPFGSLTLLGKTLYGMTYGGGTANLGTIFSYIPVFNISGKVKPSLQNVTITSKGTPGTTTAMTNSSGAYNLTGLPDGKYTLTPSLAGWKFSPATVTVSDADATQDFTVTPIKISGVVKPYAGKNLPTSQTVTVTLTGGTGNQTQTCPTQPPLGSYEFDGVDGQYTVTPQPPAHDHPPAGALVFKPAFAKATVHGNNTTLNFQYSTDKTCKTCH